MRLLRASTAFAVVCLFGFVLPAGASTPAIVETHTPFSDLFLNPCTDEPFLAEGFAHTEDHFTVNEDGSTHHHLEMSLQDVKGVTVTGARYVVTHSDGLATNSDFDAAPSMSTFIFREQYTRLGEDGSYPAGEDFLIYFRIVTVTNASGVTTVDGIESDANCG